jgi:glucose-1-phosphate adenylyltransferase
MANEDVLAVILGGGRGTRLWPLTKFRAKPAVPIAGKYRLIDIPVSNCLNSGVQQISILTQFNSVSLHRHIARTYQFDSFHPGWVQVLAAEQTFSSEDWYQGTADAVRKQLHEIKVTAARDILVLAGDHLYRMDYGGLLDHHRAEASDVTVAVQPVAAAEASRFGILKLGADGRIRSFVEKPQTPSALQGFISRDDPERPYVGSMGIYVFRAEVLFDILGGPFTDFGGDVIPAVIQSHRVFGFPFHGYWADIGTIRAFYDANLALAQPEPLFAFDDPSGPVYTRARFLPGSRIFDVKLDRVLLADGCVVQGAEIRNSVIGLRSLIGDDVVIRDTVVMGADYYEGEAPQVPAGTPLIGIGHGCRIQGAIIDKNARIGESVRIEPFPPGVDLDEQNWTVRDGIVAIPKDAVLEDGTVIAP